MVDNFPFTIKPLIVNDALPLKMNVPIQIREKHEKIISEARRICPGIKTKQIDEAFFTQNYNRLYRPLFPIQRTKKLHQITLYLTKNTQNKLYDFGQSLTTGWPKSFEIGMIKFGIGQVNLGRDENEIFDY